MATPSKPSRWGSLLQQAVAGVEARLDTILAEGEPPPKTAKPSLAAQPTQPSTVPKAVTTAGTSRSSSNSRVNDRLQERLAKAVAAKSGTPAASRPASTEIRRPQDGDEQSTGLTTPSRPSLDDRAASPFPATPTKSEDGGLPSPMQTSEVLEAAPSDDTRPSAEESRLESREPSHEMNGDITTTATEAGAPEDSPAPPIIAYEGELNCGRCSQLASDVGQLRAQVDEMSSLHREEAHQYVERIDALQAKLQFLSRETTDAARKAAASLPSGNMERKLAEKDEKIALLMEEGQNLAAAEQKYRTAIKKMRSKIGEDEKLIAELTAGKNDAIHRLEAHRVGGNRTEELENLHAELKARTAVLQSEIDSLRSEVAARDILVAKLKSDLQGEMERADTIKTKVNQEALEKERRRQKELEEAMAELEVEKALITERARSQVTEAGEAAARAAERSRATEMEMKGELQAMEGKLEAMRALAEEASSGAAGDSQAKLLRQVETLQTQYAIANENWQGIEASLVARIASLEKERDDAFRRESDMRKKARDTTARYKRQEDEFQELKAKLSEIQRRADGSQSQHETLRKRAEAAEAALLQTRSELEKQDSWKAEKAEASDKERRTWLEGIPSVSSKNYSLPDSPLYPMPPRTFSHDLLMLQQSAQKSRKVSSPSSLADGLGDAQSLSRRLSGQPPLRPPGLSSHSGVSPTMAQSPFEAPPDLASPPPFTTGDKDDMFEGVETTSNPRQMMQDVMSVSTVAAGPSVQLVERMSAAIRRLEGEKMAAKEELARISSQRDEARVEIVALMKEVEDGRSASGKVAALEVEVAEINARYLTTLEMLGEKSELVEELKADVEDVKAMYRELVERTVR